MQHALIMDITKTCALLICVYRLVKLHVHYPTYVKMIRKYDNIKTYVLYRECDLFVIKQIHPIIGISYHKDFLQLPI